MAPSLARGDRLSIVARPLPATLALLALAGLAHAEPRSVLMPDIRVGETYLVVIGSGTTPMTIEELDPVSGCALVSSERPEIDDGRGELGSAMRVRHEPR